MDRVCLAVEAMRSRFELILEGKDSGFLQAAGEEAVAEILAVEELLHPFAASSDLARVNGSVIPVRISGATLSFLRSANRLKIATEGAFDLTASSGGGDVVLDEEQQTVCLSRQEGRLDPGGLAKGWALERAAQILRDAGVTQALLHGGTSSIVAIGRPTGDRGWMVGVCDPGNPECIVHTEFLVDDSLSVSSNFERPHIVDPRTGSAVSEVRLAIARSASATEAEALSTALVVLGRKSIPMLQRRFPGVTLYLFP